MNEQPAAVLSGAPVTSLEEELANVALTEREFSTRMQKIDEVLQRRKGELTISLILTMVRPSIAQLCTWWILGKSLFASGREDNPMGAPFDSIELRSLVKERTCKACKRAWAGTDREQCPSCGSKSIETGALKPYVYTVGPREFKNVKFMNAAQMRGESISLLKQANMNKEGVFRVSISDAFTILRQHGLGVRRQEWYLRSGQRENYAKPGEPERVRNWPIRDMCIVVETAHEVLLKTNRESQLVES